MIILKDDIIGFCFPEIKEQINVLVKSQTSDLARIFLSQDRSAIFDAWMRGVSKFVSGRSSPSMLDDYQESSKKRLVLLTKTEVESAIRHYVGRSCSLFDDAADEPLLSISNQRTLRIPDDGKKYPLPPSFGKFPLAHIDDYSKSVPNQWLKYGGAIMPMYQTEALWMNFDSKYPCAVKVGTGKINALSGKEWQNGISKTPQDYLITPEQPWLDGYCTAKNVIRQFVAMPLNGGYSVEEQITGTGQYGGLQLQVYPLKARIYFRETIQEEFPHTLMDILPLLLPRLPLRDNLPPPPPPMPCAATPRVTAARLSPCMALGAGGRIRQELYKDKRPATDWELDQSARCFVHLCNSLSWKKITGKNPPPTPITAEDYSKHGLPWFDYYQDDLSTLDGAAPLQKIKSVYQISKGTGDPSLSETKPIAITHIVQYGKSRRPGVLREWLGD